MDDVQPIPAPHEDRGKTLRGEVERLVAERMPADQEAILAAITEGYTRVVILAAAVTGTQKVITNGIHRRNVSTTQAAEQVFLQTAAWNDGDPFLLSQASINAITPA